MAVDKDGGIFVSDERRGIVPRQPNLSEDPEKGPFQMEMNHLNKSHEFSGDMWPF